MKRWILIAAFATACCRHAPRAVPVALPLHTEIPVEPPVVARDVIPPPVDALKVAAEPPAAEIEPPKIRRPIDVVISETNAHLEDAFFAYDRSEVSADALASLRHDSAILAPILAAYPELKVVVEGHCDERGSAEYNLALGDRRAARAAELLGEFGVAADRMTVISYGRERPQCVESTEACWKRNRRAHIEVRESTVHPTY